ncbi:hypothetical protein ABFA07_006242 [Porites harrisoni]
MIFTSILIFSTDLRQNQGHLLLAVGQHLPRYLSHVDLWQEEHSTVLTFSPCFIEFTSWRRPSLSKSRELGSGE